LQNNYLTGTFPPSIDARSALNYGDNCLDGQPISQECFRKSQVCNPTIACPFEGCCMDRKIQFCANIKDKTTCKSWEACKWGKNKIIKCAYKAECEFLVDIFGKW
jgi:hypothetical protein